MNKPRIPFLAGLLTFFTIGLGHIYAGEARKGILLFLGQGILLIIFLPLLLFTNPFKAAGVALIASLIYFIYSIIDSVKAAKDKSLFYQLKNYNKWYIYLSCWIAAAWLIQPTVQQFPEGAETT